MTSIKGDIKYGSSGQKPIITLGLNQKAYQYL